MAVNPKTQMTKLAIGLASVVAVAGLTGHFARVSQAQDSGRVALQPGGDRPTLAPDGEMFQGDDGGVVLAAPGGRLQGRTRTHHSR